MTEHTGALAQGRGVATVLAVLARSGYEVPMPSDASPPDPLPPDAQPALGSEPVPDLAWRILEVVEAVGRLERRRGPEYRALLLKLWELCGHNARMVGDLVGIREPSAWETIKRAQQERDQAAAAEPN